MIEAGTLMLLPVRVVYTTPVQAWGGEHSVSVEYSGVRLIVPLKDLVQPKEQA